MHSITKRIVTLDLAEHANLVNCLVIATLLALKIFLRPSRRQLIGNYSQLVQFAVCIVGLAISLR